MRPIIYLAGPIHGKSYETATEWRDEWVALFGDLADVRSPMRGKQDLEGSEFLPLTNDLNPMSTQRAIVRRDHYDCTHAAAVVVNLLDVEKVSIGTCFELAWCYTHSIPVVVIMRPEVTCNYRYHVDGPHYVDAAACVRPQPIPHLMDHPFVREAAYAVVPDMATAHQIVANLLNVQLQGVPNH